MESIILSSWDHIMGPQIEKLWLLNSSGKNVVSEVPKSILFDFNISKHDKDGQNSVSNNFSQMKMYSIMCGQLMLGEVDSCKPFGQWASRFYISEYKIVVAIVFRLQTWTSFVVPARKTKEACLCLATIFQRKSFDFALNNQELIDLQLRRGVGTFLNSEINSDEFTKNVDVFANDLAALITSLHEKNLESLQTYNPSLEDFLSLEILCQAIVSHFKTEGRSVVLSSSLFTMKQVINVLSFFNYEMDYHYTSTNPLTREAYIQGIHIQGVTKDSNKESEHLLEQASRGLFPLTIVDVDLGKVWKTLPIKNGNNTYKNITCLVKEKGNLVPELLKDLIFVQETDGDFKPLIKNFCNCLISRSSAMIRVIEKFSVSEVSLTANELQSMLNVPSMVDLQILFGCAERIRPGIRSTITWNTL